MEKHFFAIRDATFFFSRRSWGMLRIGIGPFPGRHGFEGKRRAKRRPLGWGRNRQPASSYRYRHWRNFGGSKGRLACALWCRITFSEIYFLLGLFATVFSQALQFLILLLFLEKFASSPTSYECSGVLALMIIRQWVKKNTETCSTMKGSGIFNSTASCRRRIMNLRIFFSQA